MAGIGSMAWTTAAAQKAGGREGAGRGGEEAELTMEVLDAMPVDQLRDASDMLEGM